MPSAVLHFPQNFMPAGFSNSHFVQRIDPCSLSEQRHLVSPAATSEHDRLGQSFY